MSYAFKKHRNTIWYGILGLLITSIFTIYYDAYESHIAVDMSLLTNNITLNIILSVLFLVIGFIGLRLLIQFTDKQKKTNKIDCENIEKEVVSFENQEVNIEKSIEELDSLIEEIEPIDMTKDLEEIRKEIFEEEPKKEEPKEEVKVEPKKEEPKTIKNKIMGTANKLFGFTWNGMEYDY